MNLFGSLLFIGAMILLAGGYGGCETGGYLLNRIRLRSQVRQKDRAALRLHHVLTDAHLFIFTVLIGHNLAVYLVSRSVTQLYVDAGLSVRAEMLWGVIPWNAEAAATLTLMLPLFLFADIIPKNLYRRHADTLMYRSSSFLLLSWKLFRPLTGMFKMLFHLLTGGRHNESLNGFSLSLQGLREYFAEETSRPALSDYQNSMIGHLMAMHRVTVRPIMQPIENIAGIPIHSTIGQALEPMRVRNVEQLAVYQNSTSNLVGIVNLFDLMDPSLSPTDHLTPHVHNLRCLPEEMSLTQAFRHLRQAPSEPAAVTDGTSRTIGLLHLRDIARYIVQEDRKTQRDSNPAP